MFGFDPSRLVKEMWQTPWDLARELYAIATSPGPQVTDRSVEIRPGTGKAGLIIRSASAEPDNPEQTVLNTIRQSVLTEAAAAQAPPVQVARIPLPAGPLVAGPTSSGMNTLLAGKSFLDTIRRPIEAVAERAAGALIGEAVARVVSSSPATLPPPPPPGQLLGLTSGEVAKGMPPIQPATLMSSMPVDLNPRKTPAAALLSPSFVGPTSPPSSVRDVTYRPVPGVLPHSAPVLDVDGPVAFKGSTPVQFDTPPLVWNPRQLSFQPMPTEFTRLDWSDWDMRFALVTQDITPAQWSLGNPSTPPTPGKGQIQIFDWDRQNITADDDAESKDCYLMAPLPILQNTWIVVYRMMLDWWVLPMQSVCAIGQAQTDIGGGGVPGSGQANILTNSLGATPFTVTAYTLSSTATATGKYVGLASVADRVWVMWESC